MLALSPTLPPLFRIAPLLSSPLYFFSSDPSLNPRAFLPSILVAFELDLCAEFRLMKIMQLSNGSCL